MLAWFLQSLGTLDTERVGWDTYQGRYSSAGLPIYFTHLQKTVDSTW